MTCQRFFGKVAQEGMTMCEPQDVSMEEFKLMADLAGLGMDQQELEDLKPIYDLYADYARQLHTIDFGAEEMVVEFRPDWPES
jgi:hypothetical protein